ncbi:MAG TPA: NADP-dependent isocitrate dehydrogenase, partial [Nitriliruptorales bacterium]
MKIIYTYTDEAPALATRSLLPILRLFLSRAGVEVESWDISLAGRILAAFNDLLPAEHRVVDALGELGALVKTPDANVIKLPNVSASIPQLRAAVAELVQRGYDLPPYPDDARTEDEVDAKGRYDSVKGSAVNPVLREGNSDRRAPNAVKAYARSHPHPMGAWSPESMTHVATMGNNDFRSNEQAVTVAQDTVLRIEHVAADGTTTVLRPSVPVLAGEIFDGTWMSVRALREFLAEQIFDAREQGVLFSLHMKATMMKVSDPIIFGHAVEVFFADVFEKHGAMLAAAGANVRDGWADV